MAETTDNRAVEQDRTSRYARSAVQLAAVAAVCVILWALAEGDERDLWTDPAMVLIGGVCDTVLGLAIAKM